MIANRIATVSSLIVLVALSSCTTINQSMREPNSRVEFTKKDFDFSPQVSAAAKEVRVFWIDWQRLFTKRTGVVEGASSVISFASIPVIGQFLSNRTANYALYELMTKNPGYDVVFYPQYETKVLNVGIVRITDVKATARLAKIKGEN
jgi:hypothetical protein